MKAYKFRLYPNQAQRESLSKCFGCDRFVFNHFLNLKKEKYESEKVSLNFSETCLLLTDLKKEKLFLKEVGSQILQQSLKKLDVSFKNFFKHKKGYPKFKSKKSKNSFLVPQGFKVLPDKILIPKLSWIKMVGHRPIVGQPKSLTISKNSVNQYFVSILVDSEPEFLEKTGKKIGLDLGLKDFVVTSDGQKYKNHKFLKKNLKKLRKIQKDLSRKKRSSKKFERQKLRVARLHLKVSNARKDNIHKVTKDLVNRFDKICIEDLAVKNMIRNRRLSRHIADVSWGFFVQTLGYKCTMYGKELVKIDRFFPSSQVCNTCSKVNKVGLDVREVRCSCGTTYDRDINAAKNILSSGTGDYTHGDHVRPSQATIYEVRSPNALA